MELQQLRYFVAVAEVGSFSRAAAQCGVTQPSLSQQVQKLELGIGRSLFHRLGRGIALTEAGEALLPRAQRILAEVRDAERNVLRDVEAGVGPLAVGAIPTMAPYILPACLTGVLKRYPACELTVKEDLTERLIEALVQQELDCAIMSTPIDHRLVDFEVLGTEKLLIATMREKPSRECLRMTLRDLKDQPAVVVHEMHCLGQQIAGFCSTRRIAPRIVCRSTQLSTALQLVAMGFGLSLIPEMCARVEKAAGCRFFPVRKGGPTREIAIAWRKDRNRSTLARGFADIVREQIQAGRFRYEG